MLRRKAVSDRLTQTDAEQHAAIAHLQNKVRYYEGQPAARSTAVFSKENGGDERDRAGSSGSDSESGSSTEPDRECNRK